jgi:Arc/MetJ-type ribon-helix-helix transcriptional regulator
MEDVIRAGVQALQAREETEQEWLAYAREKWAERTAQSERGQATTLTTDEFSDWLESCLHDATRH